MTAETAPCAEVLASTSPEGLLRTYAALTHRMEAAVRDTDYEDDETIDDLRTQRDLVAGEILRRMRP